ncbi:MAG: ABC transporter substrate-binding protein [Dehalococcoides mccartyi]|uniref:ABC transporter substrate-binding protein n=1 Tax=Dehalococcoides mccartyi TaxID=61435 RepID=UPI0030F9FF23
MLQLGFLTRFKLVRTSLAVLLLPALLLGAAGCSQDDPYPGGQIELPPVEKTVNLTDFDGKTVEITVPVKKVVCITAAASEMICALGKTDSIVGRDSYSLFPTALSSLPEVATTSASPNIELIAGLKPDVLICDGMLKEADREKIEAYGIKVLVVSTSRPEESLNCINMLGQLFGLEDTAAEIAGYIQGFRDLVAGRLASLNDGDKVKVYWEWTADYKSCNRDGAYSQMVTEAGGINIADAEDVMYPVLSAEFVMAQNPDVIIKCPKGTYHTPDTLKAAYDELISRTALGITSAIKNNRVYMVNLDCGKGIRYPLGLLYYAKCFYPELFSDINLDAVQNEILTKYFGADALSDYDEAYGYPIPE